MAGVFCVNGRPDYILAEKLKILKVKLKELHPNLCGVDTLEGKKSQMFSNAKRAAARRLRFSFLEELQCNFYCLYPKEARSFRIEELQTNQLGRGSLQDHYWTDGRKVKKVVNKLIKKHQMTFVKGSQIMDATLLVSECIDSRLEGGTPVIMCKLDGQKVYDHVNWPFLLNTLSQSDEICMMRIASQIRWIRGFRWRKSWGKKEKEVDHMLCVDDTIILCETIVEHISLVKSYPAFELVGILGCRVYQTPTTYLSMPLGNKHKAMEIWNGILQKTEKKLTRWKVQYLSPGGRLILINFVLHFSAYLCDVLIPNPNRSGEKNGTNLGGISYDKEIRKGKGIAPWKEVLIAKYGELSPWCIENATEPYGVCVENNQKLVATDGRKYIIKVGMVTKLDFGRMANRDETISFRILLNDCIALDGVFMHTKEACRCWLASKYHWNYFWKSDIPTKAKCFTGLVIKRACLTQEVLQKKGRQLEEHSYIREVISVSKWSL
ncbi:hypothetical protein H5410_012475 [Solanum commersonii]|uniref:Reverse transcriptase domain-containing protein n=1 Tax=Solanum commersonii TaxID=4109 RepID=A0A9J6ASG5_SOLCO|nr:hypothetical protein H5410_012475 [Solanum commersonii]